MTAQESLNKLKEGNARFVADQPDGKLKDDARRVALLGGQQPFAIILGCSDSRIVPELMFDTGLGELFVVRVAGNVANTSSIASIEYAVEHLDTKLIVVLGHQCCGAVTAAKAGGDNGANLNHLLSYLAPAIATSKKGASVNEVAKKNVELTAKELKTKSDIIKNAVENRGVKIIPAYYSLDTGKVDFF
jgi:carbonic anhydrase